jgi:predicted enzyme related to lactoylglutathione lyase
MDEIQMGLFPTNGETVNISVIHGADYKPAASGTLVYFDAGDDLQPTLNRIEKLGGKVIVTKTEISPDIGFFALFIDSEGNKLGLHSKG